MLTECLPNPDNDEMLLLTGYEWWAYRRAIESEERNRIRRGVEVEHQLIRDFYGAEPDEYVGLPLVAVLNIIDGKE
jgi:hypothetical protein